MHAHVDPYGPDEMTAVAALLRVQVRNRDLMNEVIARLKITAAISDPEHGGLDVDDALTLAEQRRARATADAMDAAVEAAAAYFPAPPPPKPRRETEKQKLERLWREAYYEKYLKPANDEPLPREVRLMINRATRRAAEGKIPEVQTLADRLLRD